MPHKRIAIVSGYFNPLHVGHLRMMVAARDLADELIVIVNNDAQQLLKKGAIIQTLPDRMEIVRALRVVDYVVAATDDDATVVQTLSQIRADHPDASLVFANGGDRGDPTVVAEYDVCQRLRIALEFGVGGADKADASSRINHLLADTQSSAS
jgi:glycerol-3-phosphate cytidylyltransferase/D-beta-D-heptose 7-phosphate kinase/D-beta-D-heptose 1-phosphate adenosyltransferase